MYRNVREHTNSTTAHWTSGEFRRGNSRANLNTGFETKAKNTFSVYSFTPSFSHTSIECSYRNIRVVNRLLVYVTWILTNHQDYIISKYKQTKSLNNVSEQVIFI